MDGLTGPRGGNVSPNHDNEAARRAAQTSLGHAIKRDPRREETEAWKPNRTYKNGEESCPTVYLDYTYYINILEDAYYGC